MRRLPGPGGVPGVRIRGTPDRDWPRRRSALRAARPAMRVPQGVDQVRARDLAGCEEARARAGPRAEATRGGDEEGLVERLLLQRPEDRGGRPTFGRLPQAPDRLPEVQRDRDRLRLELRRLRPRGSGLGRDLEAQG